MQTQSHTQASTNKYVTLYNNLDNTIKKLLDNRFGPKENVYDFLSWDLKELPELTNLIDLDKAATRIIKAINNKEQIAVYGDYDVDGTTSCALLHFFFESIGTQIGHYQPSRFIEGYGIHKSSIDTAAQDQIKVLITVDCGISNIDAAEYALEKNIDLIITDHHKDAAVRMPPAYAVVNPNRRDEESDELNHLAGVSVAFALCLEIKNQLAKAGIESPSLYPLLQFVAIGTICDMAKLNPMNIKLTRHGLQQIPKTTYEGLRVFLSKQDQMESLLPSESCSFGIGPMINSKGRLDHPELALKLLLSREHNDAFNIYYQLKKCNEERKFIQNGVFKEAQEQVIENLSESKSEHVISIVYAPEWHEGVIGIVASKLVETFKVPAIVFTNSEEEGVLKASARSAGELNMFECLQACRESFIKFGGHKAAAGLSMPLENFDDFKAKMTSLVSKYPSIQRRQEASYDLEISFKDITPKLVKELSVLEPFGMGNKKPIFKTTDMLLKSYTILKEKHVKWHFYSPLSQLNLFGISFNYIGKWGTISPEEIFQYNQQKDMPLEVYYTLGINKFRGNETIQLMVESININ